MKFVTNDTRRPNPMWLALLLVGLAGLSASAAVTVIGVQYQKDKYFDEDNCLWHDRQYPGPCSINLNTGQVVKVFLKNTGASSVTVSDVTLAGFSLQQNLRSRTVSAENVPCSIYYGSQANLQALLDAGEPVWYKADPPIIPAGGAGQAVLRLRVPPVTQPISVGVVTSGGTVTTNITVNATAPALASVGFSADRTKVYLHWRRSGGAAPTTILMDGVDVTANATTVGDPLLDFGATVLTFATPLANMSFHVYQGVFADGKTATGALRTWINPFLYGTWAAKPTAAGAANGQVWVNEATAHGVNVVVMNVASDGLADLMGTPSGRQWMDERGYGVVKDDPSSASQILRMWFIRDEPDGADANMPGLPGVGHNPGVLAMSAIARGEVLRAAKTDAPVTVNIDGNLKPYNYWNWGQVPDVFMTDPYYQPELSDAYWNNNVQIPLYAKATQVYATARTAGLACEPNPLHVILYSNKQKNYNTGEVWPFPAPNTKRIEVYYALAGGAKGMAYWWYKEPDGLGNGNADALALWKEIGLLGNEIKTAQPLLVTSHPVSLVNSNATAGVWFRTLAVGNDAMIFLVVNDNYYNDSTGCHYTPVANSIITATLPSWLAGATAFEIKPSGLFDANAAVNGTQIQLNLGTLNVTRMIVVTSNPQLRSTIQARYVSQVWPGICQFAPEYCTQQSAPPSISVHPPNRAVAPGGSTTFTVVATGSDPLRYQWQKNNVNQSNGGHYSGCTTATLTVSNVDDSDVASYRCVVTNAYGTNISNPATLTLAVGCNPGTLVNADFEGSTNANGVATGWTGYQRGSNPLTLWSIQTASPPAGGLQYQQIANTNSPGGGGVRQDITECIVGATYTISGWMRGNSGLYSTCTVKVSPSASTDWSTAMDLDPPQTYTSNVWTTFSGSVVATAPAMTLWLDGQTTSGFKAECFDSITVSCAGAAASPPTIVQSPENRTVGPGGSTSFSILAAGTDPLSYQWQHNNSNITNDEHYFGSTTDTLEINSATMSDAGNYRCIVTNAYGVTNSAIATLTVANISYPCLNIGDPGFEDGFSLIGGGYIGNDWNEWETDSGVVIGYDETSTIHGGAHAQRIRISGGTSGSSGGVYQRVAVTDGQPFSVSTWIYAGDALTACSLGVDPAGGTDANSGVSWSSATTNVAWVQKTVTGSAASSYITVFYRVATSDNVKRNGYFDDAAPAGGTSAPQLVAQRNENALILNWPECPSARLEHMNSLFAPAGWTTATNEVSVIGGQKSVVVPLTESAGFFRLVVE